MWLPGLRRARYKETVWVPARPEVVIRWLCDPDRRMQAHHAYVGPWELVEGPTFAPLASGGLRVRYTRRYSELVTNIETVDDDLTARSFSRRVVVVLHHGDARRSATMVADLHVDADEERGGTNLAARAVAHFVGRARLLTLLGFDDIAYAKAMMHQAQETCQQLLTAVRDQFKAS